MNNENRTTKKGDKMRIESTFVDENEEERISFKPCSEAPILAYNEEAWKEYFRKGQLSAGITLKRLVNRSKWLKDENQWT